MRPWAFPTGFCKSFLNAPWGFARSRSHASVFLATPQTPAALHAASSMGARFRGGASMGANRIFQKAQLYHLRQYRHPLPLCGNLDGPESMDG